LFPRIKKNHLFYFFLIIYITIGVYLSLTTGISSDEFHEQKNWSINYQAIKDFINNGNYENLINYRDKYHGIAFQFISQPIQYFFKDLVTNLNNLTEYGGLLISKHLVVFLIFSVSGIFFYLISLKITKDIKFSILSSCAYLLYPYLFGHAQFNPKDIPFLSFWIINTFFSIRLVEDIYLKKKINVNYLILFSFLTAFLISIRILGILIFIQYLVSLIIYFEKTKISLSIFLKNNYRSLFVIIIFLLIFIYILNPIFWHNPFEFINSIKWMSKYPQNICTLTNGDCLYSLNLPSSYYFTWLFFKLPILILIGCCLFPFVEKKIFNDDIRTIYYGTIIITVPLIIIILILKNAALYDELRHIMFLFPLIFLISLTNLFYFLNKKFFNFFSIALIIFFIFENVNLNPYQYTWLNSFAKFSKIEKNFEVDYWGLSNKNITKKIIEFTEKNSIKKTTCIYGDQYIKEFLSPYDFDCFKRYTQVDAAKIRPFFAFQSLRNVKRSNPKDCDLIWNETFNYSFYDTDISAATLWYCD
jgi:hypothetical protein